MRGVIALLFISFSLGTYGQTKFAKQVGDTIMFAFNSEWETIEHFGDATYTRKAWPLNEEMWVIFDYYANGQVQMKAAGRNADPARDEQYVGGQLRLNKSGDSLSYFKYNEASELHGVYRNFYESGKLEQRGQYKEGVRHGTWVSFHENGTVSDSGLIDDGKYDGRWVGYYENGTLEYEGTYKGGGRTGWWKTYHDNGQLKSKVEYVDGGEEGMYESFLEDGKPSCAGMYKDGQKTGDWKCLHQNGQLSKVEFYKNDVPKGEVVAYYEDGTVKYKTKYNDGLQDGPYVEYHENAQLKIEGTYDNGLATSTYQQWDEDGQLVFKRTYAEGEVISETWYGSDGKPLAPSALLTLPQLRTDHKAGMQDMLRSQSKHWVNDRGVYNFVIGPDGRVEDVKVVETCNDYMDTLIMDVIKGLEFEPGAVLGESSAFGNDMVVDMNYSTIEKIELGNYYQMPDESADDKEAKRFEQSFMIVEEMPEFPGGMDELFQYLGKNTTYPAIAKDEGAEGVVYAQFVVRRSGMVSNVEILRGVHPELDREALRVVRKMPLWTPGKQRGKKVNVYYKLPFRFRLS